jgi:hypothetical protein
MDPKGHTCTECVWFRKPYRGKTCPERNENAKIGADACEEFEIDVNQVKWDNFRLDPLVATAVKRVKTEAAFKLDQSLHRELERYFVASIPSAGGEKRGLPIKLSQDADFELAIAKLEEIQANRDRVVQIMLSLISLKARSGDLTELIEGHLYKRPEVQELKSEYMRSTVISSIAPEVYRLYNDAKVLIEKCDVIVKNLDKTYYTITAMLEAARFYRRSNPARQM